MGELTYEEFCAQPMKPGMHLTLESKGILTAFNEELGISREVVTPRNKFGEWGTGVVSFYLRDDPREFRNSATLYVAWMHLICGVPEDQ
ncbi:hypothetical protein GCM10028796_46910 [Ramlibacter monticola]|uniref:Uncharacterized protein n=1 Tax=Ramlibacter monticola TaxID=1926872 RepID=A0A936Z7C3_9BURK|nr:hypothetical protein [Ramlibacter monticola]MBL0394316.1 hypothetical protein [Ramlibacter monticola]